MKMQIIIISVICFTSLTVSTSSIPDTSTKGVSVPLCNMFGCDCVPPAGARCCRGYRYDRISKQCRRVIQT
uniref:U16-Saltitoxin-Pre1a_1 n=1 Tax=Phidippus regius TaxID=1905328 RepID=A0A482ZC29_9ARAC